MKQNNRDSEMAKKWAKLFAKIWSDPNLKKKFISNPKKTLHEFGIDVPQNVNLHVHEDSPTNKHIVLSPPPQGVTEEDLNQIAAGAGMCSKCDITSCVRYFK